jgi:hypothetical protein
MADDESQVEILLRWINVDQKLSFHRPVILEVAHPDHFQRVRLLGVCDDVIYAFPEVLQAHWLVPFKYPEAASIGACIASFEAFARGVQALLQLLYIVGVGGVARGMQEEHEVFILSSLVVFVFLLFFFLLRQWKF